MKLPRDYLILGAEGSLPSRERGLKPAAAAVNVGAELVAPLAGAWIETAKVCPLAFVPAVAPLAGAWIETSSALSAEMSL